MLAWRLGSTWLFASSALGAYVQWQPCDESLDGDLDPDSLRAKLKPSASDGDQLLSLQVGLYLDKVVCDSMFPDVVADFDVSSLGVTSTYETAANATCQDLFMPSWNRTVLTSTIYQDIDDLYPLSTFHTELRLHNGSSNRIGCVQANITPQLGHVSSKCLRFVPCAVFLFVLIVGALRTMYSRELPAKDPDQPESPASDQPSSTATARPILPQVGDCLQYIQFVFLSGCLSLRYPGFYQPVVSHLGWFSLFHTGPVTNPMAYSGVNDGVYEINGTYGGTYGFELMHQIVGAPQTVDTWLNMLVTLLIILGAAAIALECLRLLRKWSPDLDDAAAAAAEPKSPGFRSRCSRVLHVSLSYFTFPLVALTLYQTNNAAWLPRYHTALAVTLIVLMVAAFAWLLYKIPTRNLGILVFDFSKRYRSVKFDAPSTTRAHDRVFVLVLFTLAFLRGVAVGGLQIFAPAQIVLLVVCELVLLACMYGLQTHAMFSVGTASAVARLVSLMLMISFLPKFASLEIKSAIGYFILLLHACVLAVGFFLPAVYQLWRLWRAYIKAPKPEAYGLRQLRKRNDPKLSPSLPQYHDLAPPSSHKSDAVLHSYPLETEKHSNDLSLETRTADTSPVAYFRPPRPASSRSTRSMDLRMGTDHVPNAVSPAGPLRSVSPLAVAPAASVDDIISIPRQSHDASLTAASSSLHCASRYSDSARRSSSLDSSSGIRTVSDGSISSRPLGPKWRDYSFRESDLYFAAPGPRPKREWGTSAAGGSEESRPGSNGSRSHLRKVSSGLWLKMMGQADEKPAEKGFQVDRPSSGD